MSYATQADLVQRFGSDELIQLTDRTGSSAIDSATVAAALVDADAAIGGYLGARYALPVTPVPTLLTRIACDLARYWLHGKSATESVRKAYDDALRMLRDLASGTAVLVGAAAVDTSATPGAPAATVRVSAPERRLDRASIGDFLG